MMEVRAARAESANGSSGAIIETGAPSEVIIERPGVDAEGLTSWSRVDDEVDGIGEDAVRPMVDDAREGG
jgi:hypothetical protein